MKITDLYSDILIENTKYEFKAQLNQDNPVKWAKSIVGYANGEGGYLFIGVANDGEAFGLTLDEVDKTKNLVALVNDRHIFPSEAAPAHPVWIQRLIDKGLIDADGKTVSANSLETVAIAIRDNVKITVTTNHLKRFVKMKDRKHSPENQTGNSLTDMNSGNKNLFQ